MSGSATDHTLPALLALEDGSVFRCRSFTGHVEGGGEIVFNTSMTGYQEILTDPSYREQIVVMTYPMIGNYGITPEDAESGRIQAQAIVMKEYSHYPSNYRSSESLTQYLSRHQTPGLCDIDTRALTLRIRDRGAMRAFFSTIEQDESRLVERARCLPSMAGRDLASAATTPCPYLWRNGRILDLPDMAINRDIWQPKDNKPCVAVLDFGVKFNILRMLEAAGCDVLVLPASTDAETIRALSPDGLLLSNGPGDPEPVVFSVRTVRSLLGELPMFGICLGHQLLALALGGKTYKLKFGHRGANQPVMDTLSRRVYITSQNHGFAVDGRSLASADVEITQINLNDKTVEGFRHRRYPVFSVQYHPEASPGPADTKNMFVEFRRIIDKCFNNNPLNI
jgi:carbamoyl-phosphate synthase small subunit